MPGIVGLLTELPREAAEPQLLRMVESLRHEDFYVTGTWIDESLGVFVGWTERGPLPTDRRSLRSLHHDVSLVFSGEEYQDFRPTVPCGPLHRGKDGEPECLVRRYETEDSFPASLNGRFHGLVSDGRRGTATLFNDRYGMHRIYFHQSAEAFYFAAEAKAILRVRPELRCINPRSLGELVACGCVLNDSTLFEGIRVLPAGSRWVFRRGRLA